MLPLIHHLEPRTLMSAVVNVTRDNTAPVTLQSDTAYHFNGHRTGPITGANVHDVSIDHVRVTKSATYDVFLWGDCSNVSISYADLSGAKIAGLGTWGNLSNVKISHVAAHDNPGVSTMNVSGSGLQLNGLHFSTIEYCQTFNNGGKNAKSGGGPVGAWMYGCTDTVMQFCQSYGNKSASQDGGGFDIDIACERVTLANDQAWGNQGSGFLMCADASSSWAHNTITNCSSTNDATKRGAGFMLYTFTGGVLLRPTLTNDVATGRLAVFSDAVIVDLTAAGNTFTKVAA